MGGLVLLRAEGDLQNALQAVLAHHRGDRQAQAVQAVLPLQHHRHGEDRLLIQHDALGDAAHRHGDAVVGGALALDDLVGAVPDVLVDALHGGPVVVVAPQLAEVVQVDAGDVGAAPHGQLTVAVLADDDGVDVAAVHPQVLAQQLLEPGGVQHGARAEHPVGGQARHVPRSVGQHVHRVGYDEEDALEVPAADLGDDGFEDGHVFADQVQAGLAGLLIGTGGDDDEAAVGGVVVVAGVDVHGGGVGQTMAQVHGLALGLGAVGVDEDQLGEQAPLHQGKGDGRAHESAAHHGGFPGIEHKRHSFQRDAVSMYTPAGEIASPSRLNKEYHAGRNLAVVKTTKGKKIRPAP